MRGNAGYIGHREAGSVIVPGRRRLENRGYDSAGIATVWRASLDVRKTTGKIADLGGLQARHRRHSGVSRPLDHCHSPEKGPQVSLRRPPRATFPVEGTELKAVEPTEEELRAADCVLILTDHPEFDYGAVARHGRLIVDTRPGHCGQA